MDANYLNGLTSEQLKRKADQHWDMAWLARPLLLIWDTETTGLTLHPFAAPQKQPRLIEFGGVLMSLETGLVTGEFSWLINPEELVSAEITKITGITNDNLIGKPHFHEQLSQMRDIFRRAQSMVCHNTPFDRAVIQSELARMAVKDFPWPKTDHCTMAMYTPQWGRNPKLKELYLSVMGVPLVQTHRGLDDAKAMVEIIQKEKLWEIMK